MADKRRDLRMVWNSNAVFTNSGYACESRDLLFRFLRDGWQVANLGFWGVDGYPIILHGEDVIDDRFKGLKLKIYPKMGDIWGADGLIHHSIDFQANVIFVMQDMHTLDPNALSKIRYLVPYIPIDKDPVPEMVTNNLNFAYRIITFAKFGHKALEEASYVSTLIEEGTDPEIFKPLDKREMRKKIGLPKNAFVFGMIAANKENPPRKGFQEALEAFSMFSKKHPEAALFFHIQQQAPTGFPIKAYAKELGFLDKTFFVTDYKAIWNSDSRSINEEMNACDVLLHPSQTEGFGLTIIEAQCAGIPVIVNRTTSMPELVIEGVTGEICETGKSRYTNDGSFVYPADPKSLYEKMEVLYDRLKKDQPNIAKECREHIIKNYNIDTIYDIKWKPFLEKLQEEILPSTKVHKQK